MPKSIDAAQPAELQRAWNECRREGERLAGGLGDLAQRAAVYHHLFEHSGRNHIFPLLAAHGALWAGGYFRFGMKLGALLAAPFGSSQQRRRRLEQLQHFADAFRDVNRRVCIETYATYHFTRRWGQHPEAARWVDAVLLAALNELHAARRAGRELPDERKRRIFEAFFRNEQDLVVGPRIAAAVAQFDWPLMRWLALRPRIQFAYFGRRRIVWFRDFSSQTERIEKGLRAFDLGAAVGWRQVEAKLADYQIVPQTYWRDSAVGFRLLRTAVLTGG